VLIDEIGRYYDESGLEPTKISAFLMNLAEALSKYSVTGVAVVLSVPYEVREGRVEARAGMAYVHRPELVSAINDVLSRPNVEIVKPVERRDLAEILRRRIFAHSMEELERFASDFVDKELSREYPAQVRRVLDDRGFWKEVVRTYPFHPAFIDLIERLAYRLPYLQRTRDAIKIAVHAVLALKDGLFDALEERVGLVMPYHIPLFVNETLDETILRNAPSEYRVFRLILRSNVVEPGNFESVRGRGWEEFKRSVLARELMGLKDEDARLGVKLASIIWLYSLVGLGLPMNLGEYPTTADLVYSVSPTTGDVRGLLGLLRSVLPQLIVHGDPESDAARWFFASIPSVEELIEVLKRNVTDEMAKGKLAELLEWGLVGRRGRGRPPRGYRTTSIFAENTTVVRSAKSVPEEILASRDPALIVFADRVPKGELLNLLKGRNNVVVLAPHVEGFDEEEPLAPEDVRGIRELAGLNTAWEGLLEMLRYYVAAESVDEAHLRSFVGERVGGGREEYAESLLKLLRDKVESKKEYFYRHTWTMVNRCYRKVYYHRLGELRCEEGLSLESDKPIAPIVEDFLRERGLIPPEFRGANIVSIVRDYLGRDPKREPIKVGELWVYLLTTDKANVPLITYRAFVEAVKDLVRSLDYAVRVKGRLLWKPVFSSRGEAESADEGERLLSDVVSYLSQVGLSWDDVELVYWESAFDEWLKSVMSAVPKGKVLKVKDRSGRILDVRDIKFDPKNTIKAGRLFYEEKRYPVEVSVKLPDEILEGREYDVEGVVEVGGFEGEVAARLKPDRGLSVEPAEFRGVPPLPIKFRLRAERAGDYTIAVEVLSSEGLLDARTISVPVKGEWREEELDALRLRDAAAGGAPLEEGVKVVSIRVSDIRGLAELIRVAEAHPGRVEGSLTMEGEGVSLSVSISIRDPRLLKQVWPSLSNLARLPGARVALSVEYVPEGEPELCDVIRLVVDTKGLKFRVRRRVVGA